MNNQSKVDIVIRAINQVGTSVDQVKRTLGAIEPVARRADAALDRVGRGISKVQAILMGVGMGIGLGLFNGLLYGARRLAGSLPDLIRRGTEWARTVSELSVATGLAAEKASLLAHAADYLDISQDDVAKGMEALIARGMSAEQAFNTVTSAMGLTSAEMRLLEDDARRMGRILDESAINAASRWEAAQRRMQGTLDGLGAQILAGASPALESLVNGIANTIQANLDNIVRFAVQAVNFVAGLIGGFLGLNFSLATFTQQVSAGEGQRKRFSDWLGELGGGDKAKKAAKGIDATTSAIEKQIKAIDGQMRAFDRAEQARDAAQARKRILEEIAAARSGDKTDGVTRSIDRQIEAIDRQIAALDKRERQQDWERQRADLVVEIEEKRRQLEELKTKGVFTAGMTHAEAELARQRHAADIVDGERDLAETRQRLREAESREEARRERERLQARRTELEQAKRQHLEMLASHKRLADALGRLREHDREQAVRREREALENRRRGLQDQLAEHRKHLAKVGDQIKAFKPPKMPSIAPTVATEVGAGLSKALTEAAAQARRDGMKLATDIKTFLFGSPGGRAFAPGIDDDPKFNKPSQAGLFDKIGSLVNEIGTLANEIGTAIGELLAWLRGIDQVGDDINDHLRDHNANPDRWPPQAPGLDPRYPPNLPMPAWPPTVPPGTQGSGPSILGGAIMPSLFDGSSKNFGRVGKSLTNIDRSLQPGGAAYHRFREIEHGTGRGSSAAEETAERVGAGIDANVTQKTGVPFNIDNPAFAPMRASLAGQLTVGGGAIDTIGANTKPLTGTLPIASGRLDAMDAKLAGQLSVGNTAFDRIRDNTNPLSNGRLGIDGNTSTGTLGVAGSQLGSIVGNTDKLRNGRIGIDGTESTGTIGVASGKLDNIDRSLAGTLTMRGNSTSGSLPVRSTPGYSLSVGNPAFSTIDKNIAALAKGKAGSGGSSGGGGGGGVKILARGEVGIASRPTPAMFGEAGTEAYAILRNPRPMPGGGYAPGGVGGGGGGGVVRHTEHVSVMTVDKRVIGEIALDFIVRNGQVSSTTRSA